MRILVTGAGGFIGSRFCEMAIANGHEVTMLLRPRHNPASYPVGRVVYGQLPYDIPLSTWDGVEAVVHCAAATTGQTDVESYAINLEGTRFLVSQAQHVATGLRQFVFLSSQSAHAQAVSAYGKTKLLGEEILRQSGLQYAILRPGLVFGPGQQGLFYRMRQTVKKLPVLPLLGGGKAIVQAIDVSDLAEAMLRCLALTESVELNLGDPEGVTLREFLQSIAIAERGSRKPELVIPLGPIKLAVGIAEKMHIPLPISSNNLKGMEMVQRMETGDSLRRIGLELTPFDSAMKAAVAPAVSADRTRPVRTLLIGAGKIGIVHALNMTQQESIALCGIVDRNRKAFGMYTSMGFQTEYRTDLESAFAELKPDAAVIATPASTHLALAKMCMERGVHVLIEKPTSIHREQHDEYLKLADAHKGVACHVGYMAAQFPHLATMKDLLASNAIGTVRHVWGFALQSHIMASKPVRWEMLKAQAGGGTLINFGGHVLSILVRLFGQPQNHAMSIWSMVSTEVEDALDANLQFAGVPARFISSWSIPGYARPENQVVVIGETGELVFENYCLSLRRNGRTEQVWTQLDFDVGYNAGPDYTGGGFAQEHRNLVQAVRGGHSESNVCTTINPVTIYEAIALEKLMFAMYDSASDKALPPLFESNDEWDAKAKRVLSELKR